MAAMRPRSGGRSPLDSFMNPPWMKARLLTMLKELANAGVHVDVRFALSMVGPPCSREGVF